MQKLTIPQENIYDFICDYWIEHGRSPTTQEIADEFNMYPNGATEHVKALKRKGYLENITGTRCLLPIGLKAHIAEFQFVSCES